MHAPAAHHLQQFVSYAAHLEDLAGDLKSHFGHDSEEIPFGNRSGGADDEVRGGQGVEVRRVIGREEDAVEQLAEFLGRRRRIDVEQCIQGLTGRHVVGLGTHPADPIGQVGHVFGGTAEAEPFEAAEFRDLQIGVGHFTFVSEEDVDLAVAFEACDRIDRDPPVLGRRGHGQVLLGTALLCRLDGRMPASERNSKYKTNPKSK
jgi:hypothetical protein